MSMVQSSKRKFTYTDYFTWPDEERWELINGMAYNMTPSPSFLHQKITGRFYSRLERALSGNPCIPVIAPTDVVFSKHDVVQPDVFVVCDEKKITADNIQGAPDLVVEVISPSTALRDKREKKKLYERYGVEEYIIIDPSLKYAERFQLEEDGTYGKGDMFGPDEILPIGILEGIQIPLWEVFEVEVPDESESM